MKDKQRHEEIEVLPGFEEVVERKDVGVMDLAHDLDFAQGVCAEVVRPH